jgi:oxalate decarboxylase
MSTFSRRSFMGTAVAAAGSFAALQKAAGADQPTDPGPANQPLDVQNPDSMWPPSTDSKSLVPAFKYPFSFANKRVYKGGWSREVTVRELPVSKSMAGVNMRLTAGGAGRELHWHTSAEWAIMLYGTARITAIDADGKSFVADTKKDDLWFFPSGVPHSIQGLNPDGCEFLLVFDDGNFSELETVLLSDSMAHIPPAEVLMKMDVFTDSDSLARQAAALIAAEARSAVDARGCFIFAVSGGHTPWIMLRALAQDNIPWDKVYVFQVDERIAPATKRQN